MDLRKLRSELLDRNRDNVSRTASYLELYAWTRDHGPELPWLFMAHLVSRNAGYLMSDLARRIAGTADPTVAAAMRTLFVLLERGNFLIFYDAWHHVLSYLAGDPLRAPRVPVFMCEAWARFDRGRDERQLVLDLVHNEQNLIERRAVHHPELAPGMLLLDLIEASGREKPLVFPPPDASEIRVSGFKQLARRIAAGQRIFDEVVADTTRRQAMFEWALAHPHTGSRAIYGGTPGPTVREAWPIDTVRGLWPHVHADPEPDPAYP
ncbi:MAG: hypothetical protein JWO36_7317 [Myxococcales bacterium]|nr:hypothetical protein [Myxococcales bacterium]